MARSVPSGLAMLAMALAPSLLCVQCSARPPAGASGAGITLGTSGLPSMPASWAEPAAGNADACRLALAQNDPEALLSEALDRWGRVYGYRLTFTSQERIDGVLGGVSVIRAAVLREPFAVSFLWVQNAGQVDRLVWMPSRYDGQLVVHPSGLVGALLKSVRLDPASERVRKSSRRSVTAFGLAGALQGILDDLRRHRQEGTLADWSACYTRWGAQGQEALRLKRVSAGGGESKTLLVWLDASDLRPLAVQQFGWSDELLAQYTYEDYCPAELRVEDFSLSALGME